MRYALTRVIENLTQYTTKENVEQGARQLVNHRHILVNDHIFHIQSYCCKPQDTSVSRDEEKSKTQQIRNLSRIPNTRKEGFDRVGYKLMENFGNDFINLEPMGHLVDAKAYGLNKTQQNLHESSEYVDVKKVGLGFTERKLPWSLKKVKATMETEEEGDPERRHLTTLKVHIGKSLSIKGCTIVITNHPISDEQEIENEKD
ncbi:30S ribosomal protein S4 chloroplastic, partial [Bienertia sinuspersici]